MREAGGGPKNARGGDAEPNNLRLLCAAHHPATPAPESAAAPARIVRCRSRSAPLPKAKSVIKIAEIKGGVSGQSKFTTQTFDDAVR